MNDTALDRLEGLADEVDRHWVGTPLAAHTSVKVRTSEIRDLIAKARERDALVARHERFVQDVKAARWVTIIGPVSDVVRYDDAGIQRALNALDADGGAE